MSFLKMSIDDNNCTVSMQQASQSNVSTADNVFAPEHRQPDSSGG